MNFIAAYPGADDDGMYHFLDRAKDKSFVLENPYTTGATSLYTKDDVMFFAGGVDINPSFYHERSSVFTAFPHDERDNHERRAFILAQSLGMACLGICRGAQLLCALSGGKLIQHVTSHNDGVHRIVTFIREEMDTESTHHQQMWPNEVEHKLLAWANHTAEACDEYGKTFNMYAQPEIVWFPQTRSLCIQGHPEWMRSGARFGTFCREIFQHFIVNRGK